MAGSRITSGYSSPWGLIFSSFLPCYDTRMSEARVRERVLVVDEDPDVLDLLDRQVLRPLGYQVTTAADTGAAIQQAITFGPDLIIASLTLPGLSGKDLLVALRSQGMEVPLLVMAPEGAEAQAIQAFRLGARDYLVKPLREAEVVAAVERALNESRLRHEREQLAGQLAESNRKLERRVRELTTIFGIGKAVTSQTHQGQLFDKLMESCLNVTEADMGWVLVKDEKREDLRLRAQRGMPPPLARKIHQPWDDGVSSLVMLSGEGLTIHGQGLEKFKLARFARAALIVPIKAGEQPVGVIAVAREQSRAFTDANRRMLEAVADYASISLMNARLFQALAGRAERLQAVVDRTRSGIQDQRTWADEMERGLYNVRDRLSDLIQSAQSPSLQADLRALQAELERLLVQLAEMPDPRPSNPPLSEPSQDPLH